MDFKKKKNHSIPDAYFFAHDMASDGEISTVLGLDRASGKSVWETSEPTSEVDVKQVFAEEAHMFQADELSISGPVEEGNHSQTQHQQLYGQNIVTQNDGEERTESAETTAPSFSEKLFYFSVHHFPDDDTLVSESDHPSSETLETTLELNSPTENQDIPTITVFVSSGQEAPVCFVVEKSLLDNAGYFAVRINHHAEIGEEVSFCLHTDPQLFKLFLEHCASGSITMPPREFLRAQCVVASPAGMSFQAESPDSPLAADDPVQLLLARMYLFGVEMEAPAFAYAVYEAMLVQIREDNNYARDLIPLAFNGLTHVESPLRRLIILCARLFDSQEELEMGVWTRPLAFTQQYVGIVTQLSKSNEDVQPWETIRPPGEHWFI